jgi:hypothetical protein
MQLLEHYTLNRLLYVSAAIGHHRADFTTCMEKNTEVVASYAQIKKWKKLQKPASY